MDLPALRLLSWQNPALDPCETCHQTPGHRCRTASGKVTTPHASRLAVARGYAARQGEVDRLSQALDAEHAAFVKADTTRLEVTTRADNLAAALAASDAARVTDREVAARLVADLRAERDMFKDQFEDASNDREVMQAEISAQAAQVSNLAAALETAEEAREDALQDAADVRRELAECRASHPVDPAQRTFFGACPEKPGGTSLAAQSKVVAKWGKGAAVRQFFGPISQVAPRDNDAGIVHASWKEYNRPNLTAAKVKAALVNLFPGDVVEDGHESDNDGLTGAAFDERVAVKNLFHDLVKEVRPDLLVSLTLVGYSFDPKSGKDLTPWVSKVKADVLGIDCDGVRPTKLPYVSYVDESKTVLAFLAKYPQYRWFAVPEFGCPRIVAEDPDGSKRAAWHDFYVDLWESSGKLLFATLYEYDSSPNYSLTTPAELSGWRAHV